MQVESDWKIVLEHAEDVGRFNSEVGPVVEFMVETGPEPMHH